MTKKQLLVPAVFLPGLALCMWLMAGCGNNSDTGSSTAASTPAAGNAAPHFFFSTAPVVQGIHTPGDWCDESYPEAVLVTPDATNVNRRLFSMTDGVYKITINLGNNAASFMLRRATGGSVEIFTSNQFPICLSNIANYTMGKTGLDFVYDNQHHIKFGVELLAYQNGAQIGLTLDPGMPLGISVRRCAGCK